MATEFRMPKLGLTMEEGTITEWLVADGTAVEAGSAVLVVETDKTETEIESSGTGQLHVVGEVGTTYAVGELIGWFLEPGETPPSGAASPTAPPADTAAPRAQAAASVPVAAADIPATTNGRVIASPRARRVAAERGIDLHGVRGTGPGGRIVSADLEGVTPTPAPATIAPAASAPRIAPGADVPATFAARSLADLLGVDLREVVPDPDGRISRDGVAAFVRAVLAERAAAGGDGRGAPSPGADAAVQLPPALQAPSRVVPLRGVRGTIAKRMHQSLADMAQLTLFMDADVDAVVADRERRKADAGDGDMVPSYTDYVIAAVARALGEHQLVNSQITDEGVALLPDVHVGMAVALDGGLVVPVVRDTPRLDLSALAAETSRLASAAREGSLGLPDLEGGTFSVSTLGMFGVDGFTPVINPPNTALMGVGRLRRDPHFDDDGGVRPVTRITLSLTWDHRAFDGAPAAQFAQRVCELLGDPATLDHTG